MFEIEQFYQQSKSGEKVELEECLAFIKSFPKIIVWGAGNLGTVLGEHLKSDGIEISQYWDTRYESISMCNQIPVCEPFMQIENKQDTLVIFCITNAFVTPQLFAQLKKEQICFLKGMYLYQAMVCPVSLKKFDIMECNSRKECNIAICEKMGHIIYEQNKQQDKLMIQSLDVYVTQNCSLKCKYCYIYENSYPIEKKINYPTERILEDIDIICESASYIKRMVAFGGEPFLHPDIDRIVAHMASKKNVGIIDVISNGIFSQPKEKLERLNFPNVKIDISNYNMSLDEKLIKIREKNCELLKELGLNVTIHNETPQWRRPGNFACSHLNENQLTEKRKQCANFVQGQETGAATEQTFTLKNGKFYPCQYCDTLHNLEITSSPMDYVTLSKEDSAQEVVAKIKNVLKRPFYEACNYCNGSIEVVSKAGEQGFDEEYCVR
ncbi:MAG: radical SAM protein [Lachnospiraceae bacterium]